MSPAERLARLTGDILPDLLLLDQKSTEMEWVSKAARAPTKEHGLTAASTLAGPSRLGMSCDSKLITEIS